MVGRTPATARQLASRARRRVRGADVRSAGADLARQREVVDAFFAAAHRGDFEALVGILDPDVVLRSDGGTAHPAFSMVLRGAAAVAERTLTIADPSIPKRPVLVNGAAGVLVTVRGRPFAVMGFTISGDRITQVDAILDPERLQNLNLPAFEN
jgi:ketosteroid isomerase-like protein